MESGYNLRSRRFLVFIYFSYYFLSSPEDMFTDEREREHKSAHKKEMCPDGESNPQTWCMG